MTVLTISPDYDAYVKRLGGTYVRDATYTRWLVGLSVLAKDNWWSRTALRFPLGSLPSGAQVSKVRFRCRVEASGGANHLLQLGPYHNTGQTNPETDSDANFWLRCLHTTEYIVDSTAFRTVGEKWFDLTAGAGDVNSDVENAKSVVNRFSLGLREMGDNDADANCFSVEYSVVAHRPLLEITYTVAWSKTITDSFQVSEKLLKSTVKTLVDRVTLRDQVSKRTTKLLVDQATMRDLFSRSFLAYVKLTDRVTLSDSVLEQLAVAALVAQITDSFRVSELLSKSTVKSLVYRLTLRDQVSKQTTKPLLDQMTLRDVFSRSFVAFERLTEKITVSETLSKEAVKTLTERLTLRDVFSRSFLAYRQLTERMTISEVLSKSFNKPLVTRVTISEAIAKLYEKRVLDKLTVTEKMLKQSTKTLLDRITLRDVFSRYFVAYVTLTDQLKISDVVRKATAKRLVDVLRVLETTEAVNLTTLEQSVCGWHIGRVIRKYGPSHTNQWVKDHERAAHGWHIARYLEEGD